MERMLSRLSTLFVYIRFSNPACEKHGGKYGVRSTESECAVEVQRQKLMYKNDIIRLRYSTLCPHKVGKTECSNNRAQIVCNQVYQCLKEKGVNCFLLLLLKMTLVFFYL